jgi:NAD(P) transhydrogenase subunit alpha
MIIGVLKESDNDKRVALLPEAVMALTKKDVTVLVEKDAGIKAYSSNADYEAAGAQIASKSEVITRSEMLIKINPPTDEEFLLIKGVKILLAQFNPLMNQNLVKKIAPANITSFSLDVIPRTSRAQAMDILSSMATVNGYKAVKWE